jgi:hypothetical protein
MAYAEQTTKLRGPINEHAGLFYSKVESLQVGGSALVLTAIPAQ